MKTAETERFWKSRRAVRSRGRMCAARMAVLAGVTVLAMAGAWARGKNLTWKPVTEALLKENNRPVKTWNIYQADRTRNLVLVQVDQDWFILNSKEKRMYRANRRDFQGRDDSLIGPEPDQHTPVVKTDGWDSHDVGPAQQISVRIAATGDELEIELPHPLAVY